MANTEDILRGIHIVDSSEFYYLEGPTSRYSLDSLISTLMQSSKIKVGKNPTEYNVITLKEARLEKLTIIPMFPSKHAKTVFQEQSDKKPGGSW